MKSATRAMGMLASPVVKGTSAISRRRGLTLLGWHRLGDSPDGLTTTFADFCGHLDVLQTWGATVLPLPQARRLLEQRQLPPRAVALTFDDGYASIIEQAWPELQRRGLPATLFAVSGYLSQDKQFPWDHGHPIGSDLTRLASGGALVKAAAQGLDIGSHTVNHRWLPSLTSREVTYEVTKSRSDLEDLLEQPIRSLAYPMGGWNQQIRTQVEDAGYEFAITVERGRNRANQNLHSLRRAFAFDRSEDVHRQLTGSYTWMRPLERRRNRKAPQW